MHRIIRRIAAKFECVHWATTDRLPQKGLIGDPVNKSKSLVLTDDGLRRSEELFRKLFTRQAQ